MFLIVRIHFRVETDNIWDFLNFFKGPVFRRFADGTGEGGGSPMTVFNLAPGGDRALP